MSLASTMSTSGVPRGPGRPLASRCWPGRAAGGPPRSDPSARDDSRSPSSPRAARQRARRCAPGPPGRSARGGSASSAALADATQRPIGSAGRAIPRRSPRSPPRARTGRRRWRGRWAPGAPGRGAGGEGDGGRDGGGDARRARGRRVARAAAEAVRRQDGEERRAEGHEEMRARAGGGIVHLPLDADRRAEHGRHEDTQEKIALERQVARPHAVTLPRAARRGHAPAGGILSHSATMDRRPPMDSEALREHLLALLDAQDAHMTFEEAVADFPDDAINMRPPNVPYTPWHLLEHLRIAQWDIREYIRDPQHFSPDWPEGYWPAPDAQATPERFAATVRAFQADQKALRELVADPAPHPLPVLPPPPGQGHGPDRQASLTARGPDPARTGAPRATKRPKEPRVPRPLM